MLNQHGRKETENGTLRETDTGFADGCTEEGSRILFNLDTVISVEPVGDQTMIQTRWGRMTVSEDLDTILNLANADRGGFKAPQLDSFTRINEESLSL